MLAPQILHWTEALSATATATPPQTQTAEFVVVGLRNTRGGVSAALFVSRRGFPGDPEKARATAYARIEGNRAVLRFEQLPPGKYALSLFHDENGNYALDTNFIGIPKEGVAASNNAKGRFGPPKFKDAVFDVGTETVRQTLRMYYF